MPIAMNFDLLNHCNKCEHINQYETNIEKKLSKSPLSNGTNRQTTSYPLTSTMKTRKHSTSTRSIRPINLTELIHCSSTRQLNVPNIENEEWLAIALSNQHVLIGGGSSSTLHLFDFEGKKLNTIDINIFAAFDLAWSSVLNAFIIAGYDQLQMYDVETRNIKQIEISNVMNKQEYYFWSIACHNNDLFIVLSDGLESVWRLSLPNFQRTQTLSGSEIRESNSDDRISCIRTNGYSVGMTIRQRHTNQWRVDLFDYNTLVRTHCGLTIGEGVGAFNFVERCILAPADDHQWLIVGGYKVQPNALTLMDDRTGEIKQVERDANEKEKIISNICTSETKQQQLTICMIAMDYTNGQRQIHLVQQ